MSQTIAVPEIPLRISEAAWRGNGNGKAGRSFVGYVRHPANLSALFPDRDGGPASDEESHRLALALLVRYWAADRMSTAIVTNVSMAENGNKVYLVRPPAEGSVTAGYGTDRGIPAFRCVIRDGFLVAIGFEFGRYSQEAGPDDLVLTGPAYIQTPPNVGEVFTRTRPPRALPPEAQRALVSLPSRRQLVARKVEQWQAFLNWQLDLAAQRQLGLRYTSMEVDESARSIRFRAVAPASTWAKVRRATDFFALVVPSSASAEPSRWVPKPDVRGIPIGPLMARDLRTSDRGQSEGPSAGQDVPLRGIIDIRPDEAFWENRPSLPPTGFLVNAIYMDLVPVQRQLRALTRLIMGEHANANLADFLFQAAKARTPEGPVVMDLAATDPACGAGLNELQRQAVAKAMAALDLFLLQGPPGTGKTKVIAEICRRAAHLGLRVLVASQANLAVDNAFGRLPRDPRVRPLRIGNGREGDQPSSPFSEESVINYWLACVRDACAAVHSQEGELVAGREVLAREWPRLEQFLSECERLLTDRVTLGKNARHAETESSAEVGRLGELRQRESALALAVQSLPKVAELLRGCQPFADAGEWVQLVDRLQRASLFAPLASWRQHCPMPSVLLPLLTANQGDDNAAAARPPGGSWFGRLKRWLRGSSAGSRGPSRTPPAIGEPNWAVEWIEASRLLGGLLALERGLPALLESCEEAERVCAASAAADISGSAWVKATAGLHDAIAALDGQPITDALGLEDIAVSLRPQKRFAARLARARALLRQALDAAVPLARGLAESLAGVVEASAGYLADQLARASEQVRQASSALKDLNERQEQIASALADIDAELSGLQAAWSRTVAALPEPVRACAGGRALAIGRDSLAVLDAARASYLADTQAQSEHHDVWGPIQAEWIHLLARPAEADRQRLMPLYLKRCNVVGATCSCCGKGRVFLGREECAQFDIVIIDEVSKATPPELLLPALLGCKLMLFGDWQQLPPTFKDGPRQERPFGEMAEVDEAFEQVNRFRDLVTSSLFKRLCQEAPDIIKAALVVQYRMHPQIMEVVNQFNGNQLQCGLADPDAACDHGLTILTRRGEFLARKNHILWVDTSRDPQGRPSYERQVGTSKANDLETQAVARLVRQINDAARQAGKAPGSVDVGIITFYGPQAKLIGRQLDRLNGENKKFLDIQLNTVDCFQGAERSIVIVSLVRSKRGPIGDFARTYERINVAMSRARKLLIVLGAVNTFAGLEIPLPGPDGSAVNRRCYTHILDVAKRHGGMRTVGELLI